MITCNKRQKEVYKGEPRCRCLDKSSEQYMQLLEPGECAAPRKKLKKLKPCLKKLSTLMQPISVTKEVDCGCGEGLTTEITALHI